MLDTQESIITLESRGRTLSISFNPDTTIDEYVDIFKTILKFETFNCQTIDGIFSEDYQELQNSYIGDKNDD